jgi:hypothetical protein
MGHFWGAARFVEAHAQIVLFFAPISRWFFFSLDATVAGQSPNAYESAVGSETSSSKRIKSRSCRGIPFRSGCLGPLHPHDDFGGCRLCRMDDDEGAAPNRNRVAFSFFKKK